MEKGLLEKTGKSLAEWISILKKQKFEKYGEMMKYLKSAHGLTHGYANFVTLKTRGSDAASHDGDELINNQYRKGKEHLRPILDALQKHIATFGEDVEFVPKKANVSVKRKKQFALIQASTKTRMDIGLKLKNKDLTDRLLNSGSFGSMCTHRVQLFSIDDVDEELLAWLKEAYEKAG